MSGYPYYRNDCCNCTNNNNNNNNIVVPPVIINNGEVVQNGQAGKLIDFRFFTATPQNVFDGAVLMSNNANTPTIVAQLTVNNIKAGDRIWLNGLFHVNSNRNVVVFIDTRIYVNAVVPGTEIYRTAVEIDKEGDDDFAQIINVQDVKSFAVDTSSVTYILAANAQVAANQVFLQKPITFTASLIR